MPQTLQSAKMERFVSCDGLVMRQYLGESGRPFAGGCGRWQHGNNLNPISTN
jgi:hypothetical protein